MKTKKIKSIFLKVIGSAALIVSGSVSLQAAEQTFVTIGTGGVTGVYYPTGGSICRLMNKNRKDHGIRCSVESTGGSVYNINTIRTGELDMGVAQSDWQYHAYHGTSKFEGVGPFKELRSVFSLHGEPVTVVARAEIGIKNFADLRGKRVNVGSIGSGTRATVDTLLKAMGWTVKDFSLAGELRLAEQSQALCDGKLDAFIVVTGHPSGFIKEAMTTCEAVLVTVTGPEVDKLISENAYYSATHITKGMYSNTTDVKTYGVGATFVASKNTSDEVIYQLVKSVFDNFDKFIKFHPSFTNLKPKNMVENGLSAPLHAGAVRYYKERGWL